MGGIDRWCGVAALCGLLAGCAPPTHPMPPDARPGLGAEWVQADGYRWPPRYGFAEVEGFIVLPPGVLLDRFGPERGNFFSPKGAAFAARALPRACRDQPYAVYRVAAPLVVRIGTAAPWFGETGGAIQIMTDASAAQLVADGALQRLPAEPAQCGSP
ncbi:hypothetical protein BKE38_03890 [Pseudoroseomonas deserti]|uniref:TNT domain-containing protein n=1 Tax=Teichococcus deserti TaxID=1817963 RepID=A0A1V2H7Q8_9PROT|nr:TNT domain-containing protein [Pseudoroseomonas deserti]ONG57864.1 hypothetical protein BKE38_03890 [Pseudoroseomonas deserti]